MAQEPSTAAFKVKVALRWLLFIAVMVGACCLGFLLARDRGQPVQRDTAPDLLNSVFMTLAGGFLLTAASAGYCVLFFTQVFTFNFGSPVWEMLKVRIFLANVFVSLGAAVGLGCIASGFVSPVLTGLGLTAEITNVLPILGAIVLVQVGQIFVLIWGPVEKRIIMKRLFAQGITDSQLQAAVLVGLSNPASGLSKRFAMIEEDMGALWVGPEQLVYWGDIERFAISRDQIIQIERRADTRSTTMLGGITHIILHVRLLDGGERQIRLHIEGVLTMSQKRKGMDALAELINQWYAQTHGVPAAGN